MSRSACRPLPLHSVHMPAGSLNDSEPGPGTGGVPCWANSCLSRLQASVAVPTVERGLAPIGVWSTTMEAVSPVRVSTSGRGRWGIRFCTKAG